MNTPKDKWSGQPVMRLCDVCRERMDADLNPSGTYYLTRIPGTEKRTLCNVCSCRNRDTAQYEYQSKAVRAMRRALEQRRAKLTHYGEDRDRRARYREPWRGEEL